MFTYLYCLFYYIIQSTVYNYITICIIFYFPDLWLDWVKDEIGIATTDEEKEHVTMLFEKGVKDYLSNKLNHFHVVSFIFCN